MSPVQGFVRLRKHQFGRQATFGTKVAAQRAYPFKGVPAPNLNWTDPDVDTGAIVTVAAPYRTTPDLPASLTAPTLYYNDLPLMFSGIFGGGVTGSGTPDVHWNFDPAAEAPLDDYDFWTYEFGDDVSTDWYQFGDGYMNSLEITGPSGLGALSASMGWRFGSISSTGSIDSPVTGTVPSPGLSPSISDVPIYLKDGAVYIASSVAGLGAGQVSDALNNFVLRITGTTDEKRAANGSQTFAPFGYGRTGFLVEYEGTFHKTADIVGTGSESDAWMSDAAVNRYLKMVFTSTVEADTATPYEWDFTIPLRYYTRAEGEIGGNSAVVLTGRGFFDAEDLGGFFPTNIVNTLADIGAS